MSEHGSGPALERLAGRENWADWKFAMQTYLEVEDLWSAVKPEKKDDGTFEAVDPTKNRKARGKIILHLERHNFCHVKETKTAKEAWEALEVAFEDAGLTRKTGLIRKFGSTHLEDCSSMEEFVNTVMSTAHQLRGIGMKIPEDLVGGMLLAGLPESYRPMIMALENSGTVISGDSIKTKLLQELPVTSAGAAYSSRKQDRKPEQKRQTRPIGDSKGPKCRRCQKFGHIAKDCRSKDSNRKNGDAWCTVLSTVNEDDHWYFDSGASNHFAKSKETLDNLENYSGTVVAANRGAMHVVAKGSMKLWTTVSPNDKPIEVNDVRVIPDLSTNLLSVSQIVKRGSTVTFDKDGVKVINAAGAIVATGSMVKDIFRLNQATPKPQALAVSTTESLELWHKRMGHLNFDSVRRLKNGLVSGVHYNEAAVEKCKVCAMGKQTRLPFSKAGSRASDLLELVHSDICGPMEVPSLGGSRYYLSFIDDKSRRTAVYFLKQKSADEVYDAFEDFRCKAERQTGRKLKIIRTDNGKEFTNKKLQNLLSRLGIRHQTTVDYTPEQNGLAERGNRTTVERARCMLFEANLPKIFWAEATATAVYLANRSPTKGHDKTPEEVWTGRKQNLAHIRVFGTPVMVHVPKQKRKKWDAKAHECILTGFEEDVKAYRLWDPKAKQIIKRRDVTFLREGGVPASVPVPAKEPMVIRLDFEESIPCEQEEDEPPLLLDDAGPAVVDDADPQEPEVAAELENNNAEVEVEVEDAEPAAGPSCDVTPLALPPRQLHPPGSPALWRSGRERSLPGKFKDFILSSTGLSFPHFTANSGYDDIVSDSETSGDDTLVGLAARRQPTKGRDPVTPAEAMKRDDAKLWKDAMDDEYRSLMENGTWELVQLPPDRKAIGCKWLFKTKEDEKGNIVRYKARLVAQGFTQKFGVDFDEVFAPVARQETFRILLTIASRRKMVAKHVDVKTAYLHGKLEETIYMKQPAGYSTGDDKTVCRLKKSLYGLKQSARVWNHKIDAVFKKLGFGQAKADPCLYVRKTGKSTAYIIIYVDDMVVAAETEEEFEAIFNGLQQHFTVTNLGDLKHFLGMEVERAVDGFKLNQQKYINKLASRFGLEDAKASKIPLDPAYLQQKEENDQLPNNTNYLSLIGGLLYIAVHTRPDIAVSTSILAQKSSRPTQLDWQEAKRVLRYLMGTSDHKLHLGSTGAGLEMYVDADWAGDHRDRKSNSGYLVRFGGGLVSWGSRKQSCVALSSTEAELVALTEGCQELVWIRKLLGEFGIAINRAVPTYEDNQSCIKLVDGNKVEKRTKHIETRYFYVRDLKEKKMVDLQYCPTEKMLADILTKPLQNLRIKMLREEIGLLPDHVEEEY